MAGVVDIAAVMGHAGGERASRRAFFLVNLWAVRLAAHIWARRGNVQGGGDHRYGPMRQQFGARWWWWSLVQVFLLQAILIWFIPAPLVAAMLSSRGALTPLGILGVGLAAAGLLFEAIADLQLASFRAVAANRGKVMDRGLWGWSRHPNYFGEVLMWWGFFLIGFFRRPSMVAVLSPILVTFLLLQVSGIALTEETMDARRPGYAAYRRRVSALVPMPPRK